MITDRLSAELAGHVERQGGVFSTRQALAAGFDAHELTSFVRRGLWVRLRRGVYAVRPTVDRLDPEGRHRLQARAVSLTLRAPVTFSHVTAAALLGLPLHDVDLAEVHVTHDDPRGSSRHEAGIWHHTGGFRREETRTVGSVSCTSLARTAFDVGRLVSPRAALVVADSVLARGVTQGELLREMDRGRDWPGARGACRALAEADGRSESVGESVARWMFHKVGMPPDDLQLEVMTSRGQFRSDFAWARWGLLGEFDGKVKYGRLLKPGEDVPEVVWKERRRELALEEAGWTVVRFSWSDVMNHDVTRDVLLRAVARSQRRAG